MTRKNSTSWELFVTELGLQNGPLRVLFSSIFKFMIILTVALTRTLERNVLKTKFCDKKFSACRYLSGHKEYVRFWVEILLRSIYWTNLPASCHRQWFLVFIVSQLAIRMKLADSRSCILHALLHLEKARTEQVEVLRMRVWQWHFALETTGNFGYWIWRVH